MYEAQLILNSRNQPNVKYVQIWHKFVIAQIILFIFVYGLFFPLFG